ncbi:MAG: HlyC/CorC family transporter [Chloroflexi bacterium]|nr:HlyC/CorC family transporter [Chloroflexota bacterium]
MAYVEMSWWAELLLVGALILVNAFFAASEIAIISIRRGRIRKLAEEGDVAARIAQRLSEDSSKFLATIQIGITLVGFFTSAIAAVSSVKLLGGIIAQAPVKFIALQSGPLAIIIITLAVALITLVIGELVPKNLALQHVEPIALFVARPIDLLSRLAAPLISVLTVSTDIVVSLFGSQRKTRMPFVTEEEIRTLVDAGEEEGVFQQEEKDMIYGIFDMGEKTVGEVMVPRVDMVAMEANQTFPALIELIIQRGYSRIPLYEGNIDNIVGIVYAKDLMRYLASGHQPSTVHELARPALFVPESKRVDELLRELQQKRIHMAVVVDEYGGTAGIVTIEDLLEEIVGEIQDEYDREESQVEHIGENEVIVDSRLSIDDLNRLLDLEIEGEDFDTVGGFVYHNFGKIPQVGEEIQVDDLTISVLSLTKRRINKVRIVKGAKEQIAPSKPSATDLGTK